MENWIYGTLNMHFTKEFFYTGSILIHFQLVLHFQAFFFGKPNRWKSNLIILATKYDICLEKYKELNKNEWNKYIQWKLRKHFQWNWRKSVCESHSLSKYYLDLREQPYIDPFLHNDPYAARIIVKFRAGNNSLMAHQMRYSKTPFLLRLCPLCQNKDVENFAHFSCICPSLEDERNKFMEIIHSELLQKIV